MAQTEGVDRFTNYESIYFTLNFDKRGSTKNSFNLSFGGILETKSDNPRHDLRKLSHELKKLIYFRSKDGYYKKNFIFLEHIPNTFKNTGRGMVFFELFCFLEEPCDRDFITDYLKTLFTEIQNVYTNNKQFKSHKYAKKQTEKKSQEESCNP